MHGTADAAAAAPVAHLANTCSTTSCAASASMSRSNNRDSRPQRAATSSRRTRPWDRACEVAQQHVVGVMVEPLARWSWPRGPAPIAQVGLEGAERQSAAARGGRGPGLEVRGGNAVAGLAQVVAAKDVLPRTAARRRDCVAAGGRSRWHRPGCRSGRTRRHPAGRRRPARAGGPATGACGEAWRRAYGRTCWDSATAT